MNPLNHHHKVTLQYSTTGAAKERPGYSKQTLANGSFLEPNGHPWIKMVVYNWMRVPKSSPWKKWLFHPPIFHPLKKPVGFWGFLVVFYAMQKIKSFRFLWWSCGLMQDMKNWSSAFARKVSWCATQVLGLHPGKLTDGTPSHGGLVQMIFLFNCMMFRFQVNFQEHNVEVLCFKKLMVNLVVWLFADPLKKPIVT